MGRVYIGTIDCAFNNTGWSITRYDTDTEEICIESTGIIKKDKIKIDPQIKLKTFQDLFVSEYIIDKLNKTFLNELLYEHKNDIIILGMEVQSGSKSARSAACLGMAKGILASIINKSESINHNISIYQFTPNELKRKVGKGEITKDHIIEWVLSKYFQISSKDDKKNTTYKLNNTLYAKNSFEHIADSLVITQLIIDIIKGNIDER